MRLAIVTREYPPETAWGGIGSFYKTLVDSLVTFGVDVEVFTQTKYSERDERVDDVLVHYVCARSDVTGTESSSDIGACSSLGAYASALSIKMYETVAKRHHELPFDLIEGHEHLGINALININGLKGAKTITRYHTPYKSLVDRGLVDWPVFPNINELEYLSIKHADIRLSTSTFIDHVICEDFGVSPSDYLTPNFVEDLEPSGVERGGEKENLIIFVGRMVWVHKRPDLAIKAFLEIAQKYPDWRIEFAGLDMPLPEGGSVWNDRCMALLASLDASRFKYHGVLNKASLNELYSRAKIILVPSDFESFGLVALEAVMRGCVPIVSRSTALADIIQDDDLIHQKGSYLDLSKKIIKLIDSESLIEEKARAIQGWVDDYKPDVLGDQNYKLYNKIMKEESTGVEYRNVSGLKISIVTPSYNQAEYIEETILSVWNQDYRNFEHIVMDGGSSDGTVEILKKYPHLQWVSESDEGQAHAINKGILRSSGDIIAYLNSDDVYRPGAFAAVAKFFEDNPDVSVIVGRCDYINEGSEKIGELQPVFQGFGSLLRYWGWGNWHCIPQQSVFWRRSVVENVGLFDVRYHYVMDLEMWFRIALKYDFHVIDDKLAGFRLIEGTKTVSNTHKMYEEEFSAFCRYLKYLPKNDVVKTRLEGKRHLAGKYLDLAEHYFLTLKKCDASKDFVVKSRQADSRIIWNKRYVYTWLGLRFNNQKLISSMIEKMHRNVLRKRAR